MLLLLFAVERRNGLLDGCGGDRARLEDLWLPARFLDLLGLLDQHSLVDDILSDVLRRHQLCMAIVDHFVDDLVDEDEVFANTLLVEHSAVVTEHLHHAVEDVQDCGGLDVVLGRRHEVDAELLGEEVVDSVHILKKEGVK